MFYVSTPSIRAKRLVETSYECLWIGIHQVKPNVPLSRVGHAIEQHAHAKSCSVVQEYCGHGIGRSFHEEPQVLHYFSTAIPEIILLPGMTFTIEPMINSGKRHVKVLGDKWTVVTKDHSLSAQWEHTVLVTKDGYEILTLGNNEKIPDIDSIQSVSSNEP